MKHTSIDSNLIALSGSGDTGAFGVLYQKYAGAMFNICLRMTNDYFESKDILQESFIIAFRQLEQLKEHDRFGGWLKRIVINECLRTLRKANSWNEIGDDVENMPDEQESNSWWESIEIQSVNEAIKELPLGCRQVFILYAIEDFAHKEIASMLDISESTSKTQYMRARHMLKEKLVKLIDNGQFKEVPPGK